MSYVTGSKKTHFFVRKLTVDKLFGYFVKNVFDSSLDSFIVTRVESFGKKCDSSQVIITSFLDASPVDSLKIVTRVIDSTRVTLSLVAPTTGHYAS